MHSIKMRKPALYVLCVHLITCCSLSSVAHGLQSATISARIYPTEAITFTTPDRQSSKEETLDTTSLKSKNVHVSAQSSSAVIQPSVSTDNSSIETESASNVFPYSSTSSPTLPLTASSALHLSSSSTSPATTRIPQTPTSTSTSVHPSTTTVVATSITPAPATTTVVTSSSVHVAPTTTPTIVPSNSTTIVVYRCGDECKSLRKRMYTSAAFAILFFITTVVLCMLLFRQYQINKDYTNDPMLSRLI